MTYIIKITAPLFLTCLVITSIYNYSVPKIEGGIESLSTYQGKKMLLITLPIQQSASTDTFLYCLDTLAAAHTTTLKVIAVPSYEDGYTPVIKDQLMQWYQAKLGNYITITEGLYTHKNSASQHALFKWLTHIDQNESIDADVEGPEHKFFINTSGELYSVLGAFSKIGSTSVQRILNQ